MGQQHWDAWVPVLSVEGVLLLLEQPGFPLHPALTGVGDMGCPMRWQSLVRG